MLKMQHVNESPHKYRITNMCLCVLKCEEGEKIPHFAAVQRKGSMMYEVGRPSRSFALSAFIRHAVSSAHTQPRKHACAYLKGHCEECCSIVSAITLH